MIKKLYKPLLVLSFIIVGVIGGICFFVDNVFNGIADEALSFLRNYIIGSSNKVPLFLFGTLFLFVVVFGIGLIILYVVDVLSQQQVAKLLPQMVQEETETQVKDVLKNFDKVMEHTDEQIILPPQYTEIENHLNQIKYHSMRNEQLAKESEQRKNDLVVYLAHDLKTPLTSIIGYLTLLNDERTIPPNLQEKYLSIALDKSNRLEELINEFFDITRFNLQHLVLDYAQVDLSVLLQQLSDEFYPVLFDNKLSCVVSTKEKCVILADANKIARVFDNLLKNAIAYSTPNTEIQITVTQQQEQICISFSNEGLTIPEHKLNHIFEKFYRLDEARSSQTGGAGLGLAISKQIVEAHQGKINATSEDGYTCFTVILPKQ